MAGAAKKKYGLSMAWRAVLLFQRAPLGAPRQRTGFRTGIEGRRGLYLHVLAGRGAVLRGKERNVCTRHCCICVWVGDKRRERRGGMKT